MELGRHLARLPGGDGIEHQVEQHRLVGNVSVKAHRGDADGLGDPPGGDRIDPLGIGNGHGGRNQIGDAHPRPRAAPRGRGLAPHQLQRPDRIAPTGDFLGHPASLK